MAVRAEHLDAHPVAELEERRFRLAALQDFLGAALEQAAGAVLAVAVGHRARADDGAGGKRPRLRRVRDQAREIELHVLARVGLAEQIAVHPGAHRTVRTPAVPGLAQFVRRDRDRRERGGRLGMEEAEAFGEVGGHQRAQAHVVQQYQQPYRGCRSLLVRAHRHVAGDDAQLHLEVDAVLLAVNRDVVAGPEQRIGAALVHERLALEVGRQRLLVRAHDELGVDDVGRAVGELVRARQRRHELPRVEVEGADSFRGFQIAERSDQQQAHVAPSRRARRAAWAPRGRP